MKDLCLEKLSDKELVDFLIKDDPQIVEYVFYKKYHTIFVYHIKTLIPYEIDARDIIHDFYLNMQENQWTKLKNFAFESSLKTWISVVFRRFVLYYKKRTLDFNGVITLINEDSFQTPKINPVNQMINMDVKNAINQIKNQRDRRIAVQLLIEEMDPKEVSLQYNMTVDHIYTIKNRVLKNLRLILQGYRK